MKTISISDEAHKKMTEEIESAEKNNVFPKPTYGSLIEDMTNKRYKNRKSN